ncbi:DUF1194 domain-containing protein [Marivita hallyeonensis]|uniref:VWFA domain-containing protein n=1 Tax=Marivita hallyeonensis TaxID=996342 RepID=A0A1M5XYX6_9RHOB|nr:DUF1194 domain-containing protein [Marivita hallyeonensis]SHI04784.1 Protein of unknown function [Marivita hallyeonensis]
MRIQLAVLAALAASVLPVAAVAQEHCRLALVLALDVSSSVDAEEYVLQRDGLAAALDDPTIRSAILEGPGYVSIAIYEWSGRRQSTMVRDWVALTDGAAIDDLIATLTSSPRSHTRFPTAMGYALGYGATLLARGPECDRQVIDVSGDGENNDGFPPRLAYKNFPFANVTVNGLAVLGSAPEVIDYFQREVRYGFGAFVETSLGYQGYREAMTRKLFRELNDRILSALPVDQDRPG